MFKTREEKEAIKAVAKLHADKIQKDLDAANEKIKELEAKMLLKAINEPAAVVETTEQIDLYNELFNKTEGDNK